MSLHPRATRESRQIVRHEATTGSQVAERRIGCRRMLRRLIARSILIILVVMILAGVGFYVSQPRYYNILIIGSDQRTSEPARADVLLLVAIPKSREDALSLITVPRDTKVEHAELDLQKLAHFYAMWDDTTERLGNRDFTVDMVEELLGITIHGTVELTFDSFNDLVDLLGGVELTQGHLSGDEAEELVHNRFIQPGGDFGRADAQRDIFKSLLPKLYDTANLKEVYNYLQTSERARLTFSKSSAAAFLLTFVMSHRGQLIPSEINEEVLPGEGQRIYTPAYDKSLYYWVLDTEQTEEIIDERLR